MLANALRAPLDDYMAGLERLRGGSGSVLAPVLLLLATLVAGWWIYVPVHELLHAYGCLWSGGEVTRLEIDAVYGAALLQSVFPFVAVGSDYAGQLTGFDTRGSDVTYLVTVYAPFVLTIFPGVSLLRAAARCRNPLAAAATLGASIAPAFAPFISLVGDFYEIGSILVSRVAVALVPSLDVERWRGDDVFLLIGTLPGGFDGLDWVGVPAAFLTGSVLAVATYGAGRWLDRKIVGDGVAPA
jgi:hypothetical protein